MRSYDHLKIEKKWQEYWEKHQSFKTEIVSKKKKFYVLDMLPYPSGSGLHVGHVVGYTGSDVISRYKRMKGHNVMHPMGWDSFGLPAEQYAIRTGVHPQITTEKNIANYKRQLKALGLSYDWSLEISTNDPRYYKWTQWIFTRMHEKGLAYKKKLEVNFCPKLGTVLSNEEINEGKSIEGGFLVEKRELNQWMLSITKYAQRLLDDLDLLDWPEHVKKLQRNWIGKSVGVEIYFKLSDKDEILNAFTTRIETIFGVSYLAISPEHPLALSITTKQYKKTAQEYVNSYKKNKEIEKYNKEGRKSGVFTGSEAINPVNGEKIPIWIADYVLSNYATGVVMGVPSSDERDNEFAKSFSIKRREIFDQDGKCKESKSELINLNGLTPKEARSHVTLFLEKFSYGKKQIYYKLRDWLFSRQRYWGEPFPILFYDDGSIRLLELDELPLTPPIIEDFRPSDESVSPLAKIKSWVKVIDKKSGRHASRETDTMPQWAGSCWYYLRYIDPNNQQEPWSAEKEHYWMPVDLYIGGVEHAVLHLLYARFFHKVLYDIGYVSTKEPFLKLRNQGIITSKTYKLHSGAYVTPSDVYHKDGEYRQKSTGNRLEVSIEKMSKSKLNGLLPDDIIKEYGADSLRLYELFMAPFDKEKLWSTNGVTGCYRFLSRVYDLVISNKIFESKSIKLRPVINKLIKEIENDICKLSFNTAIAKMMAFSNLILKEEKIPKSIVKDFIKLLYPFAPHFGEECWRVLGGKKSLVNAKFPEFNDKYLKEKRCSILFQVNGRVRKIGEFKSGVSQQYLEKIAKSDKKMSKFLIRKVEKIIFVPDKLINFVL